jgi:hypothetical protein
VKGASRLAVLGPLVLAADLLLLFGGEVVLDVESLADLVGGLALDHVGNGLAANVKESLDVEVVGSLRRVLVYVLVIARGRGLFTRMISKSISWSTCMNFWSHSSMSVDFLRESESSS